MPKEMKNISIIGDGGWGTTLAVYLARRGHSVTLWGAFPANIRKIERTRMNTSFLPGIKIPRTIKLTADLESAVMPADVVVLAVPSQYINNVLMKLKRCGFKGKMILSVIKGIDAKTLERMSQLIQRALTDVPVAVLSGPTIAGEVAREKPSTAVIAAKDMRIAKRLQSVFHSDMFRIYTNTDVVGVEVGGSIKNIIAIACGICDGLGYGTNAKSAIVTRGLVEMARLGKALGAREKTFAGLTGLGDLVTTCFSLNSRNRFVGEQLGKGGSIKHITSSMKAVAEGVLTVKAVWRLSEKYRIPMPITSEIYQIIYHRKDPKKAVSDLMLRKTKSE